MNCCAARCCHPAAAGVSRAGRELNSRKHSNLQPVSSGVTSWAIVSPVSNRLSSNCGPRSSRSSNGSTCWKRRFLPARVSRLLLLPGCLRNHGRWMSLQWPGEAEPVRSDRRPFPRRPALPRSRRRIFPACDDGGGPALATGRHCPGVRIRTVVALPRRPRGSTWAGIERRGPRACGGHDRFPAAGRGDDPVQGADWRGQRPWPGDPDHGHAVRRVAPAPARCRVGRDPGSVADQPRAAGQDRGHRADRALPDRPRSGDLVAGLLARLDGESAGRWH